MKRIICFLILVFLAVMTSCGDDLECSPGTRKCDKNVLSTCMYGKWLVQECKDAAPMCDEKHGCVPAEARCGNGVIEQDEICDGQNLNGRTCADGLAGTTGTLLCSLSCQYDTSNCTAESGKCQGNYSKCSEDQASIEICLQGSFSRIPCGEGKACVVSADGAVECEH